MARKKPSVKKLIWKPFMQADYRQALERLVHFSAKTVNSNTPAFGVRLGEEDHLDLPYVAASTLGGAVPVDYEKNASGSATLLAQISAVREGRLDEYASTPPADIAAIIAELDTLATRYETPSSRVGMRLRQVILQDQDKNDVTLTPLQSAGFSAVLESRLREEAEKYPDTPKRGRGVLGIGGSNPQNVGRYVRAMGNPLWFQAPAEDRQIRQALRMHYQGVPLNIPLPLLHTLRDWRLKLIAKHGHIPTNLETHVQEREHLRSMVEAITSRAAKVSALLHRQRDHLPDGALLANSLPALQWGLIDPACRDPEWKRNFARMLRQGILNARIRVDGELRSIGIGEVESESWLSVIEEML